MGSDREGGRELLVGELFGSRPQHLVGRALETNEALEDFRAAGASTDGRGLAAPHLPLELPGRPALAVGLPEKGRLRLLGEREDGAHMGRRQRPELAKRPVTLEEEVRRDAAGEGRRAQPEPVELPRELAQCGAGPRVRPPRRNVAPLDLREDDPSDVIDEAQHRHPRQVPDLLCRPFERPAARRLTAEFERTARVLRGGGRSSADVGALSRIGH